jgi:hypothetical protein
MAEPREGWGGATLRARFAGALVVALPAGLVPGFVPLFVRASDPAFDPDPLDDAAERVRGCWARARLRPFFAMEPW